MNNNKFVRGIKNKDSIKASEVLILGFNKNKRPDLYLKYLDHASSKIQAKK